MFKKSRRKIVVAIMSVLIVLWMGTLAVIYISSYFEMSEQNKQMLKAHADMYVLSMFDNSIDIPREKPMPNGGPPGFANSPIFQLSTFYSVAMTYDKEILEIRNDRVALYSDDELESFAKRIVNGNKVNGTEDNLVFYKADKGDYILVVFMDNTIINESAATLIRYTFIFGGIVLIIFFFLAMYLAKKIVQPLEESYQKQKQFISDAGHELKTPISIVSTNAELLSREIGDNKWLSNIQYENERMGMLVRQLLELARTENVLPIMDRIDFSRLVNGEALPFESVAYERGFMLNCNIVNDIAIEGNATQLKQLVSILIDNAIRHSKIGNEIYLKLVKENDCAKLSIINEGDEISKEQQEHIFERFYRVDTVRNGEDKHYGLGLAIARSIVTNHKGQIEVRCYNGMVEFSVRIPIL